MHDDDVVWRPARVIREIRLQFTKAQTVAKLPQSKFASRKNRNASCYLTRSSCPAPARQWRARSATRRQLFDGSSGLFSFGLTVERTTTNLFSRSNQNGAPSETASAVIN